ncbi:MAG: hypothetical protein GAK29_00881 [Acinetobacter bereziniae]|uniref:Uncharacterized protein n=1 Tax=Acinetobacter bereziniae TaxID=106648 RepID=A0A833UX44_ACIBZ|nr:MAG: hypothetical protein GAK29_00881 [Acinetobacter bereziniae]
MIPQLPMLYRRQMRIAVVSALQKADLWCGDDPVSIDSPGNWNIQQTPDDGIFPCIFVRTSTEGKASIMKAGIPEFDTAISIDVMCVLTSTTAEKAQDDMEQLWYQVENILLTDYSIVGSLQNVQSVDSKLEIVSSGNEHIAAMSAAFVYEGFEVYDSQASEPPVRPFPQKTPKTTTLDNVDIHLDLVNVVDKTGEYPNSRFPESVVKAPRTHGPDGRDEAHIDINLRE